jgi:hypothetical protein
MIVKIKLQRLGSLGSEFPLELYYETPNGVVAIDSHYEYITEQEYTNPTNGKMPHKITFAIKEESKVMTFDFSGMEADKTSDKYKNALKQRRLYDVIIGHPFVETETKPAQKVAQIRVVDEDADIKNQVAKIKKRLQVSNFVNNLNEEGMINLCAYLNKPVISLDPKQIYVELLKDKKTLTDKRGHIAIVDGWAFEDMDRTLSIKHDSDAEVVIVVNKAIFLKIIDLNNGGYYYGGTMIASSDDELYKYFRNNKDYFEKGLKTKVFELDNLPIDLSNFQQEIEETNIDDLFEGDMSQLERERKKLLVERGKELKIMGNLNKWGIDLLEQKIREREQLISMKENNKK